MFCGIYILLALVNHISSIYYIMSDDYITAKWNDQLTIRILITAPGVIEWFMMMLFIMIFLKAVGRLS